MIQALLWQNPKALNSEDNVVSNLDDIHLLFLENIRGNENGNNRRSSLSRLLANPTSTIHQFWRKFDDKYMRPVFGGRGFMPYVPGSPSSAAEDNV